MEDLKEVLQKVVSDRIYKVVFSIPSKESIFNRMVIVKLEKGYQAQSYTEKQVFHKNIQTDTLCDFIEKEMTDNFSQLYLWDSDKEYNLKWTKKRKLLFSTRKNTDTKAPTLSHNRQKNYLLPEGTVVAPLVDMGIFTREGMVVKSMQDKYRQINRFLEIINDEISQLPRERKLRIVDFGCGKSYLTFILYHYFTVIRKTEIEVIGLDLKEEVIEKCRAAAQKYGYTGLHFEVGDINGYQTDKKIDMVLTLHACDTATDYALYHAMQWKADFIFSVPCCQHELNMQAKSEKFSSLMRHGIVKERFCSLMTDSIRANLLAYKGYSVQLMEFVDFTDTPKNLLIRAVRKGSPIKAVRDKYLQEVQDLCREFSLSPTLLKLLFP